MGSKGGNRGDFQISNSSPAIFRRGLAQHHRNTTDSKLLSQFIWAHNHWVDKQILERLNIGDESAISEALAQIHQNSLSFSAPNQDNRSYSEALQNPLWTAKENPSAQHNEWKEVTYRKKANNSAKGKSQHTVSIFLYDIPDISTGKDIWNLFKECGKIKDIILPRKRDVRGKRIGFVHTDSEKEAGAIISNAKQDKKLGRKIKMTINGVKDSSGDGRVRYQHSSREYPAQPKKAVNTKPQGSENVDFSKKLFEFTEVEIDEEVESALLGCKIGYTWFEEKSKDLQEKLCDIGLSKYKVTLLSQRKFLIRKDQKDSWDDLVKTDLSVWFCNIRDFEDFDHTISRVIWLECRGLPMPAWKEENLRAFTDRFGKWISWSYQSDDLSEFFNPLICIDTTVRSSINDSMKILYKGKNKEIELKEILDLSVLANRALPMEFSESDKLGKQSASPQVDSVESPVVKNISKSKSSPKIVISSVAKTKDSMSFKGGENKGDISGPLTSNSRVVDSSSLHNSPGKVLKEKIRQKDSSSEQFEDSVQEVASESKSEIHLPPHKSCSQTILCSDVHKKLKLKSNRGRPKKVVNTPRNPFEIGVRFKHRKKRQGGGRGVHKAHSKQVANNCTQIIPIGLTGNTVLEALEIIKSAEYMGLEIRGDRDNALQEIGQKLDTGEI
ncbi:hypothetical protein ACET3Z_008081 [Daucus carota]